MHTILPLKKKVVAGCLILMLFLYLGCGGKRLRQPDYPEYRASKQFSSNGTAALELVPNHKVPPLLDDLDKDSLLQAIERSLIYFGRLQERDIQFLGARQYTVKDFKETLTDFRDIVNGAGSVRVKEEKIRDRFDFYRAGGADGKGRILFTGYYEPVLNGAWKKTGKYRYPLYRFPKEGLPRYTRAEIEGAGSLAGRGLEIIWVDDFIDLFFLHVQGSGKVRLSDGKLIQVGYAQSNGYPYRSIGRHMLDRGMLAKNQHTLPAIKKYLRENPDEAKAIFNYNERYIYFRLLDKDDKGPIGALNVPVTEGRTIASDPRVYPKGGLAFIGARKPLIDKGELVGWIPFSRFVLSQDTGNAISGAGRIDIFCGGGAEAEAVAGRLKEEGEIYFLIKKR